MSILVTGGAGYIGSHAVKLLCEKGYDVIVLDNLSTGNRKSILGGRLIVGDLNNKPLLKEIFENNDIDGVMHFAAKIQVGESMEKPGMYFEENITNGINLLEAMKESKADKFIFSSSAAVYGQPEYVPVDEKHPISPESVYGETKAMFEKILYWYGKITNIRYICLRYFNASGCDPSGLLGEKEKSASHLIPIVLQAAQGKRKLTVYGDNYKTVDGTCVRDYVHVNDLAKAHLLAYEALKNGSESNIYNLGNGRGYTVLEVIKAAQEVTGIKIDYIIGDRRSGDPAEVIADSSKISKDLNFSFNYSDLKLQIKTAWDYMNKRK